MRPLRILYVSQYYPPEMGAPAARVSAMASRWAASGAEVTVLTAFPNHPTGIIPPAYRGRRFHVEERDGVRIVRTFIYPAPNRGIALRSLSYLSFAVSSVVQSYGRIGRPDVVVATSPQFLVAASGWCISRRIGAPLVLEIRDLWPDSIVAVGAMREEATAIRALRHLERFLYGQADLVVSVTHSFVPHLVERGARRVTVVTNGADPERFRPAGGSYGDRAKFRLGDRFVAAFVGTLGMAHGLESVLDAAERLRHDEGILFWLVGEGARRFELEAAARRRGLRNVRFEGQVPRESVPEALACADVALVLLRDDPLFETVLPSKMFEAMATATPVILGVRGEAERLLRSSGGGIVVPPGSGEALADAVVRLRDDPSWAASLGSRGRRHVVERYTHDALATRYLEELRSVAEKARS